MFLLKEKTFLNDQVFRAVIEAPLIAKKAQPGQFVIVRVCEDGERIPLTISDFDRENGTICLVVQAVGATTMLFSQMKAGEYLPSVVGPLGKETELEGVKKAAVIGGGVGCAIAYPVARKLHEMGAQVDTIVGFRSSGLVIMQEEFEQVSDRFTLMTDDGTAGEKGLVTDALKRNIEAGADYDLVIAIGPLVMMKFVSMLTKNYGIKTMVSMNPVMIDGTGMCGGCRITVGGETRFACVDGPDFDGHLVDFDEAMARAAMYRDFERHSYENTCNLLKKGE
ncbi:MAG: sulfide/dihydroorotate dehydrogenase-like FAD/NAD-binding protein [Clostridia bacterium]|nr:sulfide/dihydroorotate dehydrogenase-like FAD/NAD-binding protein [Clostridia bacterium]